MQPSVKLQNCQKGPSYSLTPIKLTPKKQNQVKLEENDEPTLQKNLIDKIKNAKIQPISGSMLQKKVKRPWNQRQDQLLKYLVETRGAKQWAHISSFFQQRCGKQCRERWHNHLRNGIRKGQWTSEEEWTLFLGVQAYGKRWSTISKMLEGRTENTLKNHWNCKMKPKKPLLEKKLNHLLQTHSFQQLTKNKLFQIIKEKKKLHMNRIDEVSQLLENALRQFFTLKEQICGNLMEIQTPKLFAEKQNIKQYDINSFESFGKSKNFETTTCQRKNNHNEEVEGEVLMQEFQYQSSLKPFELDYDEKSNKQPEMNHMDIESSFKDSSIQQNGYYDKSSSQNENSYQEQSQLDNEQEKSNFCAKFGVESFCSPMKQNVFESIDLENSNEKKKLFN